MADDTILGDYSMETSGDDTFLAKSPPRISRPTRRLSIYDVSPLSPQRPSKSFRISPSKRVFPSARQYSAQKTAPTPHNQSRTTVNQRSTTFENESLDFTKFVDCAEIYSESPPSNDPIKNDDKPPIKNRNVSALIQNESVANNVSSNSLASFERNEKALMQNENSFLEERFPSFIGSGTPVKRSKRILLNTSQNRSGSLRSQRKSPRTKQLFKEYKEIENSILVESEIESASQKDDDAGGKDAVDKKDSFEKDTLDVLLKCQLIDDSLNVSDIPIKDIINMDDSTASDSDAERRNVDQIMVKVAEIDPDLSFNESSSILFSPINDKRKQLSSNKTVQEAQDAQPEMKNITKSLKKNVSFCFEHQLTKSVNSQQQQQPALSGLGKGISNFKASTPLNNNEFRRKRLFSDLKTDDFMSENVLAEDDEHDDEDGDVNKQDTNNRDTTRDREVVETVPMDSDKGSLKQAKTVSRKLFTNSLLNDDDNNDSVHNEQHNVEDDNRPETDKAPIQGTNGTVHVPRRLFQAPANTPKADYEANVDFGLKKMLKTPIIVQPNETVHVTRRMFQAPSNTPKADYVGNVDFGLKNLLKSPTKTPANETVHVTRKMFEEPAKSPEADFQTNVDFGLKNLLKSPTKFPANETVHVTRKMFEEPQKSPKADFVKNVDFGLKNLLQSPKKEPLNETVHVTRKMFEEPQKSPKADFEKNVDFGLKNMLKTPEREPAPEQFMIKKLFQPTTPEANYYSFVDSGLKRMMQPVRRSQSPVINTGSDDDETFLEHLFTRHSGKLSLISRSSLKSAETNIPNSEANVVTDENVVNTDSVEKKPEEVRNDDETMKEAQISEDLTVQQSMISVPETQEEPIDNTLTQAPEVGDDDAAAGVQQIYLRTRSGQKPIASKTFKLRDSVAARMRDLNKKFDSKKQKSLLSLSLSLNHSSALKAQSPPKAHSSSPNLRIDRSTVSVADTPQKGGKTVKTKATTLKKAKLQDIETVPEVEHDEQPPAPEAPKKTRGRTKKTNTAETETVDDDLLTPKPKTTGRGRKKAATDESSAPARAARGRKKKIVEDDLAELAGFHQEVEDARLDQLIIEAADGNVKTGTRRGKAPTTSARNRKRKADPEQEEKLNSVIGQAGNCDVQVLEEYIEDENIQKMSTRKKAKTVKEAGKPKEAPNLPEPEVPEKPKRGRKAKTAPEAAEVEATEPVKPKTKRTAKSEKTDTGNSEVSPERKRTQRGKTKPKAGSVDSNDTEKSNPEPEPDEPIKPKARRAAKAKSKPSEEQQPETAAASDDASQEKPKRGARKRAVTTKSDDASDEPEVKTTRRNLRSRK